MKKCKTRRIRPALAISVLFAAGILITSCGNEKNAKDSENSGQTAGTQMTEKPAADNAPGEKGAGSSVLFGTFTSQTLDGTEVTQDIFKEADLTMVNIWGTFCGPCIREMPDLGEISREYEGTGFQIVGLLCDVSDPGDDTALEIVETTQADYTHLIASPSLQNGILQQVQAVPTTIFVDSEGNQVGEICTGSRDKNYWVSLIEQMREEVSE